MKTLVISDEIKAKAPDLQVLQIEAVVTNPDTPDTLWAELVTAAARVHSSYAMDMVNKRPGIAATRTAYKACGKEPNRYRPSTEALMRRMVKGLELYRTTALVDLINLLSVACGHSIGGFDAAAVDGDTVTLGIGCQDEPYEGIGRGALNIAGMPVWRDSTGGIGTPTSDNERTKLTPSTSRLLMIVNMYGREMHPDDIVALATRLLETYAGATDIETRIITARQ